MKVIRAVRKASALSRQVVTVALSAVLMLATHVAPAHAITRPEVLKRANTWIKKHVQYSQSAYYQGYRRDCSGFVSMAWRLKTSLTSSSIGSAARRISLSALRPGDAVRRSGHVEIFDGWKNRRKRQYWALEESTWGKPALRGVKQFKSGYSALRLRGIKDPRPITRSAAPIAPSAPAAPPASAETTPSIPNAPASSIVLAPLVAP